MRREAGAEKLLLLSLRSRGLLYPCRGSLNRPLQRLKAWPAFPSPPYPRLSQLRGHRQQVKSSAHLRRGATHSADSAANNAHRAAAAAGANRHTIQTPTSAAARKGGATCGGIGARLPLPSTQARRAGTRGPGDRRSAGGSSGARGLLWAGAAPSVWVLYGTAGRGAPPPGTRLSPASGRSCW